MSTNLNKSAMYVSQAEGGEQFIRDWTTYTMNNDYSGKLIRNINDAPILFCEYHMSEDIECKNNDVHPFVQIFMEYVIQYHKSIENSNLGDDLPIKNIYLSWDKLSESNKRFYNKFIEIYDESKNVIPPEQYSNLQKNQFLCRLKKIGGTITFETSLPVIADGVADNILYYDEYETLKSVKAYPHYFSTLYRDGMKSSGSPNMNGTPKIDTDKVIIQRLYGIKDNKPEKETDNIINFTDNIWSRNSDNVFFKKENNKLIRYGKNDDTTKNLLNKKCVSTNINLPASDCTDYVLKCLLKDDNPNCVLDIDNTSWPNISSKKMRKEILNDLHPLVALQILRKFGFKTYQTNDIMTGKAKIQVINYDKWVKLFAKNKFGENIKSVTDNENLARYLQLLVDFVNANPGILNRTGNNADNTTQLEHHNPPNYAKENNIPLRREYIGQQRGFYESILLNNYIKSLSNNSLPFTKDSQGYYKSILGRDLLGIKDPHSFTQSGGNVDNDNWFMKNINQNNERIPLMGGKLMEYVFKKSLEDAKKYNKHIDKNDVDKIFEQINELAMMENKMFRILMYIQEYNKILVKNKNVESELIDMSKLKELVNNYKQIKLDHDNIENILSGIMIKLYSDDEYKNITI